MVTKKGVLTGESAGGKRSFSKYRLCVPFFRVYCQIRSVGFSSGEYLGHDFTSNQSLFTSSQLCTSGFV